MIYKVLCVAAKDGFSKHLMLICSFNLYNISILLMRSEVKSDLPRMLCCLNLIKSF